MAVRNEIPYPAFDDLLLYCNRMYGQLDGALKRLRPRLTITGLQVLTEIAKHSESRTECTQARIARSIGVTPSSLVTTIKGLEANGLVTVDRNDWSKTQALAMTKDGQRAWRLGLVVRDDVLAEFNAALPGKYRRQFLIAARMANQSIDRKKSEERQAKYLKSLVKHDTRAKVRDSRKRD
jgi:DNA-binding MarR family transcriptional regulator